MQEHCRRSEQHQASLEITAGKVSGDFKELLNSASLSLALCPVAADEICGLFKPKPFYESVAIQVCWKKEWQLVFLPEDAAEQTWVPVRL